MTSEAHSSTGIPIEKLQGMENYNNWKFSMKMLLMHEDLLECIESTDGSKDLRKNQRALAKICLSVHPNAFSLVRNAKSAYEAWTNLQKAYEDKGLCRRLGLLRLLFGAKLEENACNMEAYITKITEIAQQLHDIGSPLDDDFIAVIMLSGLTPDYDPLIMALENSSDKLVSETVKMKLLQEFYRRDDKTETASALTKIKKIKCYRCKKPGHTKKNCPKNATSTTPVSNVKEKKKVLLSALSVNLKNDVWYVDSGATNHMCNSKSVMSKLKSTKELSVNIANGDKLCTAGLGEVKIKLDSGFRTITNVYLVPQLSTNLLSVSELTRKGYTVNFNSKTCRIMDEHETIATASYVNGIFQLDSIGNSSRANVEVQPQCMVSDSSSKSLLDCDVSDQEQSSLVSQEVWHRRLGHLNNRSMNVMRQGGGGAQLGETENCDAGDLNMCVELIPRTPIGLPRNKHELDAHCQAYQTGMVCMDAWIKRCLPTDGQKLLQQQIGGARALMRFLCTNDTALRREFLKEPTCWGRVSPDWSRCVDELQVAVRENTERAQQLTYFNRNAELCCSRDDFIQCVANAGRSCSIAASTLLRRMAWVLAQDIAACNQQPRAYCAAPPPPIAAPLLTAIYGLLFYPPRL